MGRYLGYVVVVNNGNSVYYNFQISHEIQGYNFKPLSVEERGNLFPESQRKEINLYFDYRSNEAQEKMAQCFQEESLYVIDFVTEDLEDNIKSDNERNPTGYKIAGLDYVQKGLICSLDEADFFVVVKDRRAQEDFLYEPQVQVVTQLNHEHMKHWKYHALVQLENGFLSGPYPIEYRDVDDSFYVKPMLMESKYLIWGYPAENIYERTIIVSLAHRYGETMTLTVFPKHLLEEMTYLDVITEEQLVDSFIDCVETYGNGMTKLELSDMGMVLEQYENSFLTSRDLPPEVRDSRLGMMEDLFTSQEYLGATLQRITSTISTLLEKQEENHIVTSFFQQLGQVHPTLASGGMMYSADKMDRLMEQNQTLEDQLRYLRQELKETREKAGEVTKRALDERLKTTQYKYQGLLGDLKQVKEDLSIGREIGELGRRKEELLRETNSLRREHQSLNLANGFLEENISDFVEKSKEDITSLAFSGFVSHKMISAAAEWEAEQRKVDYENCLDMLEDLKVGTWRPLDLVSYLVDTVQLARPDYHHNTILNMVICVCQGFLTVFAGEPGCGKTSICHILAQVLGLTEVESLIGEDYDIGLNRYVEISVERGWTSKRDFVGYFNPLSKNFDKTNSKMYDALKILDLEQKKKCSRFPMLVLLDEANLSPMEYYWADFMNICDDLNEHSQINLGENHMIGIPSTLHFLATMNHDHTTEMLSPRLIDRSWVIKLPSGGRFSLSEEGQALRSGGRIAPNRLRLIPWQSLEETFVADSVDLSEFSSRGVQVFGQLKLRFREMKIPLSPRTELAMLGYLSVATKYMIQGDGGEESSLVALDYVVAQKVLPKIMGNGEEYRAILVSLGDYCEKEELNHSATLIAEILERGDKQMKYYQFF